MKRKTPANFKEHFLGIWADLNDPLELAEKLDAYDSLRPGRKNNPNQTFKMKEEFRKPFPIKKSPPVGDSMITAHQDPLEQYLDSQVPELKEESPSSVMDAGLLESSSQSVLPARELKKRKQQ
ncbi:hypothetical protein NPIL_671721 [Nephila pilipes]|uniref:Uncharacterized protein n=1 Tax=Nephila pilipes TaxID=299642 RepID=A0A8X6NUF8_NEPPI|nr:hypothetical protein NPIL_671721 [Nephila pilipes]